MDGKSDKHDNGFFQRSDGLWEDGKGNFAAHMLTHSGIEGENKFFTFRSDMVAPATKVVWPADNDVAVFNHTLARALIRRGYARTVTDEEAAAIELQPGEPVETPDTGEKVTDDEKVPVQPKPANNGSTAARGEATAARKNATKATPTPTNKKRSSKKK